MKKSKIFLAADVLLLSVVGAVTTKAHSTKKFWSTTAKYKAVGLVLFTLFIFAQYSNLTAGAGNGITARINSGSGTLLTSGGVNQLHFNF